MSQRGDAVASETETAAGQIYRARVGVLEPALEWRLEERVLTRTVLREPSAAANRAFAVSMRVLFPLWHPARTPTWPGSVGYGDIAAIRLSFAPTRFSPERHRCDLHGPGGAHATIFSSSYAGPADFTDQSSTYRDFVGELVARVQRARPEVALTSGLSWPRYLAELALPLVAGAVLLFVLLSFGLPGPGPLWLKIVLLIGALGGLGRYVMRNRPREIGLSADERAMLDEWRARRGEMPPVSPKEDGMR